MNPLSSISQESISRRAYHLWEEAGRPHGRHEEHWHQAERDLQALHAKTSDVNGNRGDTVQPAAGNHGTEKVPHSTNYVHPGVSTDSLRHHRR